MIELIVVFFEELDENEFWVSQVYSVPVFLLGLIFSAWLIPYFTIRRIETKNRRFINQKNSFVVLELCVFLNKVPLQFKQDESVSHIFSGTSYVSILSPNLFKSTSVEEFLLKVLNLANTDPAIQKSIILKEYDRLKELRLRLENFSGFHSLNVKDETNNPITEICFEIRRFELSFTMNKSYEELHNRPTGIFGLHELVNVYRMVFNLLKLMVKNGRMRIEE